MLTVIGYPCLMVSIFVECREIGRLYGNVDFDCDCDLDMHDCEVYIPPMATFTTMNILPSIILSSISRRSSIYWDIHYNDATVVTFLSLISRTRFTKEANLASH